MTTLAKPRVLKDFEKLNSEILEQIKLEYPSGFHQHLVSYVDREGNKRLALPFETADRYYLIRMSIQEAKEIIEEDEDYDNDGVLKEAIMLDYSEKYDDQEDEEN